jgi:excisionase family DNA binding protein
MSAVAPGIPEYLTAAEVAGLYGVTASRVRYWARTGLLTGTRTPGGRSWRFPAAQFADVIRASGGIPPQRRRS